MGDNETPDAGTFKPLSQIGAASESSESAPSPSAAPAAEGISPAALLNAGADTETPDAGTFKPLNQVQPSGGTGSTGGDGKTNEPGQPGALQRFSEISGAEGLGTLAAQTLGYYGTMPLRTYHRVQGLEQAYAALKAGDLKKATMIAHTLATGPDDPITSMAKNLLKVPYDEAVEAYKAFQNNPDKVGASLTAAQHGIRSIPLIGAAAEQIGHTLADDWHNNNWTGLSGDLLGIVPSLLMGAEGKAATAAEASTAEGASEAAQFSRENAIRPSQRMISREPVPVTALQNEGGPTLRARAVEKLANNPAAEQAKFAAERTQPAAVNATVNTMEDVARNHIQAVRDELGIKTPFTTDMSSLLKQSDAMEKAAEDIYSKFDDASAEEQQQYKDTQTAKKEAFDADQAEKEQAFNEAQDAKKEAFDKAEDAKKKAATEKKPYKPGKFKVEKFDGEDFEPDPRPKTFRELQSQRKSAQQVMLKGDPAAYATAHQSFDNAEQEMDAFAKRHPGVVSTDEYNLANATRRAAAKHEYIATKLNIDEGTDNIPTAITQGSLKSLPRQFNLKYGDGAFQRYLGPEGFKNYNMVRDVLQDPEAANGLVTLAQKLMQHGTSISGQSTIGAGIGYALAGKEGAEIGGLAGPVVRYSVGKIAENLLFNPEFGQTVMSAYRAASNMGAPLARLAFKAAPAGLTVPTNKSKQRTGVTHTWHPDTGITPVQ